MQGAMDLYGLFPLILGRARCQDYSGIDCREFHDRLDRIRALSKELAGDHPYLKAYGNVAKRGMGQGARLEGRWMEHAKTSNGRA